MQYKIGFIGEKDSIYAFGMLGMDVYFVTESRQVRPIIRDLEEDEYGVIFLTQTMAEEIPQVLDEYDEKFLPAIIVIPNEVDADSLGLERIQEKVKKAIGQNIL